MKKFKKIHLISLVQLIVYIVFFVCGICFNSTNDTVSSNVLGMLTKIQITNNFQNFLWCFTNNFAVLFIVFWLSYWTFGVIGTLWCVNSSFALGSMIKFSLIINSWICVCFISLELIASIFVIITSTYFRIKRFQFKTLCKKNHIDISDNKYKATKKSQEKNILFVLAIIAFILLIGATLETITLSLM